MTLSEERQKVIDKGHFHNDGRCKTLDVTIDDCAELRIQHRISIAVATRDAKIRDLCEYVIAKDKTPEYEYSHNPRFYLDTLGEKPPVGSRWKTPARYCRDILAALPSSSPKAASVNSAKKFQPIFHCKKCGTKMDLCVVGAENYAQEFCGIPLDLPRDAHDPETGKRKLMYEYRCPNLGMWNFGNHDKFGYAALEPEDWMPIGFCAQIWDL